ncbi:MAG: RNA polymerase sigma factor [Thioalkalivibrio sp.]|jgi:RNA polymerase sigma-70 factor (ECF subfamily)|nr:RNA polymerase sigma factor [Thioalkalivibrio sp.]
MFGTEALNRLYRYAFTLTAHEADAYDLLQDGLERYLRSGHQDVTYPEAFARRIIRNRFIDNHRQQCARQESALREDSGDLTEIGIGNLETIMIARDELETIWRKLEMIDREILFLWALEGQTAREIAAELQVPRGTILSRIHRLRARFASYPEMQDDSREGRQ